MKDNNKTKMKNKRYSRKESEKFQGQPEFNKPVEAIDKKPVEAVDYSEQLADLTYSINFEKQEKQETTKKVEEILINLKQSEINENENA